MFGNWSDLPDLVMNIGLSRSLQYLVYTLNAIDFRKYFRRTKKRNFNAMLSTASGNCWYRLELRAKIGILDCTKVTIKERSNSIKI